MSRSSSILKTTTIFAALMIGAPYLAGCASSSGGVEPAQVSATKYGGYSCSSLRARSARISREALELSGKVDKRASNDAVAMGVALVLFWPAAFFVKGDGPEAARYSELVGERRAIEAAAKRKGCRIKFKPLKANDSPKKRPRSEIIT